MMPSIYFKQLELGPMQNYAYFVGDADTREVAIIDPGWDFPKLQDCLQKEKLHLKCVLLTHGHFDHIAESLALQTDYHIPVYISNAEKLDRIHQGIINLNAFSQIQFTHVADQESLLIGGVKMRFIHTPGHTPGGMCILVEDQYLLTGDTLFLDGCGRWDLPLADKHTLLNSIQTQIAPLPDTIQIYPGHNYHKKSWDTLANQKQVNPCFHKRL